MLPHEAWFADGGGKDAIEGFITPRASRAVSALLTFQKGRETKGNLVEIGTYLGKTFIGLAMAADAGETVLGIDIYPGDMQQRLSTSLNERLPVEIDFFPRLVKMDSARLGQEEYRALLQGGPVRFAHIDGDHTYEAVRNDLWLVESFLTPDAVVVIDDFLHEWYPDVTEGILDGLRASETLQPVAVIPRSSRFMDGGTKLVCARPAAAETYLRRLIATFPELKGRHLKLAGHPAWAFFNYD